VLSLRSTMVWFPLLVLVAGCYDQPPISRDKPLTCSENKPSECPTGFACVGDRICAPRSCNPMTNPCPVGLVCAGSRCVFPDGGVPEGGLAGSDAGGSGDGGSVVDVAFDFPAVPDLGAAPADGGGN
jgi:hypothetical protein